MCLSTQNILLGFTRRLTAILNKLLSSYSKVHMCKILRFQVLILFVSHKSPFYNICLIFLVFRTIFYLFLTYSIIYSSFFQYTIRKYVRFLCKKNPAKLYQLHRAQSLPNFFYFNNSKKSVRSSVSHSPFSIQKSAIFWLIA